MGKLITFPRKDHSVNWLEKDLGTKMMNINEHCRHYSTTTETTALNNIFIFLMYLMKFEVMKFIHIFLFWLGRN